MRKSIGGTEHISIASYSFDPATRFLYRNGEEILLPRKAGDLLAVLIADVNSLVPREQIFASVWPEGFVHEGNLTQTIYLLRKSLAADPAVAIENVPRRGYRLRVRESDRTGGQRRRLTAIATGALALAVLVSTVSWTDFRSSSARPLPLKAREDMQLAMYHFDRFVDLKFARASFESTTRDAPAVPEGYAGLALIDAMDGFDSPNRHWYCREGRRALERANALGSSALTHVSSAMLSVTCNRALGQARRELDAALAIDPSDPTALTLRSRVALWEDRPREAISFASKAAMNDPTSPEAILALGVAYYYRGDLIDASTTFRRLLELMPNRPVALEFLERSYEGLGDLASAEQLLREAKRDPRNADWVKVALARMLALNGYHELAVAMLRRSAMGSDAESLAAGYTIAGDQQAAIANLEIFAAHHSLGAQIAWLDDPRFASLRREFPELRRTFVTWRQ
jgi:DNA-binding winged helix-turn-helix (wHTH) protein/Flp pilus assembly protein TadD